MTQTKTTSGAAKNVNRVPQSAWRKWSESARASFNVVYAFIHANEAVMTHPAAPVATPAHWKTLAWNSAWIAADAVDKLLPVAKVR